MINPNFLLPFIIVKEVSQMEHDPSQLLTSFNLPKLQSEGVPPKKKVFSLRKVELSRRPASWIPPINFGGTSSLKCGVFKESRLVNPTEHRRQKSWSGVVLETSIDVTTSNLK